jgi:hypothetical protein
VLLRLALDTVEQLLLLASGRDAALAVCWAVYVVVHLPPSLATAAARAAAVQSLLERTAPQWALDARAHKFLSGTLGLPPAWLEVAQVGSFDCGVCVCVRECLFAVRILHKPEFVWYVPGAACDAADWSLFCTNSLPRTCPLAGRSSQ